MILHNESLENICDVKLVYAGIVLLDRVAKLRKVKLVVLNDGDASNIRIRAQVLWTLTVVPNLLLPTFLITYFNGSKNRYSGLNLRREYQSEDRMYLLLLHNEIIKFLDADQETGREKEDSGGRVRGCQFIKVSYFLSNWY